jgi:hypothetical protein
VQSADKEVEEIMNKKEKDDKLVNRRGRYGEREREGERER